MPSRPTDRFLLICLIAVFGWPQLLASVEARELFGKWRSSYGATMELHRDFTCNSHFADECGDGKWQLRRGDTLRMSWYSWYWKKTFSEDDKILSLAKGVMRLKTSDGMELWFHQK